MEINSKYLGIICITLAQVFFTTQDMVIKLPMVLSNNKRLHEIGMGIFFIGFIYTIVKYHIYT